MPARQLGADAKMLDLALAMLAMLDHAGSMKAASKVAHDHNLDVSGAIMAGRISALLARWYSSRTVLSQLAEPSAVLHNASPMLARLQTGSDVPLLDVVSDALCAKPLSANLTLRVGPRPGSSLHPAA